MLQVTDSEGTLLSVNTAWLDQFGYTEHEILKCNAFNFLHDSHKSKLQKALQTLSNEGRLGRLALTYNTKRGDVVETETTASMLSTENGDAYIIWSLNEVTERNRREREKNDQLQELQKLKDRLELERDYLRIETRQVTDLNEVIGHSPAILQMIERIKAVAKTDASVLITGDTGVGKELVAQLIHNQSNRSNAPLVTVNCASIPHDLFESEFFGHVRGAFTGAVRNRVGRLQLADGGTLFLDEVGEIPLDLQSKLLRSLQQKSFERVGEETTRRVDVRIIAATNRDLETEVEQGRFREDLYYRLSVFPISVPPLHKRKEDVALLAAHFLDVACTELNRPGFELSNEQTRMLQDYDWPGNIRELKNVIERAVILSKTEFRLDLALPEEALKQISGLDFSENNDTPRRFIKEEEMRQVERNNLVAALEHANWKIAGRNGAAQLLGLKSSTLSSRVKTLGIIRPKTESLYNRLGGIQAIRGLADQLLPALRSDAQLGRFWQNRGADSIRKEKELLVYFLCERTGGPYLYSGRSMAAVHEGMGITESDWQLLVDHVSDILEHFEVMDKERVEVLASIEKLRADIVEIAASD